MSFNVFLTFFPHKPQSEVLIMRKNPGVRNIILFATGSFFACLVSIIDILESSQWLGGMLSDAQGPYSPTITLN